jgi:hypothetical protein
VIAIARAATGKVRQYAFFSRARLVHFRSAAQAMRQRRGRVNMNEMTRADFVEQMAAFERRLNERFDLLERLMALGFDDTSDQIKMGMERFASVREPNPSHDLAGHGSARRSPQPSQPPV